jgi:tetratricopeptide (TPR) repeat protein
MRFMLTAAMMWIAAGTCLAQTYTPSDDLDTLFADLRVKESSALRAEAKIWQLWMLAGNPSEDETMNAATVAMNGSDFRLSEEILNRLITANQTLSEAYNKRATLYFLMGRYDESLADIVKTLELEPRHFGALSGRGMIYQRLGKSREALQAYRDALAINPNMVGARIAIQQLNQTVPDL